ncbi:TVP38/TMEM64 family protein [Paenibacillus sp. GYB003]|uniref:TVP38/TMEM64 family protein n=1 Tax=Paenibacillus sp. GYB003 TaxID=2994392 RepID=UPI002F96AFB1
MKIWQIGLVYTVAIVIVFLYRDELADWMQRYHPPLPVAFGVALCFVLFPVLPYKLIIGMLGYMYGPPLGFFVSWSAATLASVILYALVRSSFRERGRAYMAKFERIDKLARFMERRPFAAIFVARLIPVLPQSLVNVYPAFLSIRLSTYATASALGKIPNILLFAYLGNELFANVRNALIVASVYGVLLAATAVGYRIWVKRI